MKKNNVKTKTSSSKKPVAEKTATGKNKGSGAGKTASKNKSSSGRTAQSAKRTPRKKGPPQKAKTQPKEQRVLVYGIVSDDESVNSRFPKKFPFWARLKIEKRRTTLVIDEVQSMDKKRKKIEEHFVHREAIHPKGDGSNVKGYEKIEPNPDPTDDKDMYLKNPTKLPKRLFKPHNRELAMPEHLKEKYDKNNHKNKE